MINREQLMNELQPKITITQQEKISNVAKTIIKISEDIEKKILQKNKIDEEIFNLKKEQIEQEETAQTLLKIHLKQLKKNF